MTVNKKVSIFTGFSSKFWKFFHGQMWRYLDTIENNSVEQFRY